MRRFILLAMLFTTAHLHIHAQSVPQKAQIEFTTDYASSSITITPLALGYNASTTAIAFNTSYHRDPMFDGAILTSNPIAVGTCRSLGVDLQSATTIFKEDPVASKGVLRARLEIADAETGELLWSANGLDIFLASTLPGHDTAVARHLDIDLSGIHAKAVVLRVTGTYMFGHVPAPHVSIENTALDEMDEVR